MKALILTEEHIEKLSDMVYELFPEYTPIIGGQICEKCDRHLSKEEDREYVWLYHSQENKDLRIHWLQMCLFEIPKVLKEKYSISSEQLHDIRMYLIKGAHPVEFLYERYKQITNGNSNS